MEDCPMNAEANEPEKKIIIDEDWKTQVEAEREAARRAEQGEPPTTEPPAAEPPAAEPPTAERPSPGAQVHLPPPDLSFLIGTLYLQATIALGLMPHPSTKKAEPQFEQAKHTIDLLAMLEQKTEGNRTADESAELDAILHELRMAYVQLQPAK
jgi:hypothetical protein